MISKWYFITGTSLTILVAGLSSPAIVRAYVWKQHLKDQTWRMVDDPRIRTRLDAVGKPFALDFTDQVSGSRIDTKDMRGKVVLVDFWATWCGPCMLEMPTVQRLKANHPDGFQIVGVSLDKSKDQMLPVCKARGMDWPEMIDPKGWGAPFFGRWGIWEIPTAFLIDKNGILRDADVNLDNADGEIDGLLAEKGTSS